MGTTSYIIKKLWTLLATKQLFSMLLLLLLFLYFKGSRQGGHFDTTILLISKILNKSCWNGVNTINQIQRENTKVYKTLSCYKDYNKIIVIYNSDFILFASSYFEVFPTFPAFLKQSFLWHYL